MRAAAQHEALEAVAPARELFDLVVAARLGEAAPCRHIRRGADRSQSGSALTRERCASDLERCTFRWRSRRSSSAIGPGFDCILGNPPWEEATVEELGFWALRYPGFEACARLHAAKRRSSGFEESAADLVAEYEPRSTRWRPPRAAPRGPYPGMGTGDPTSTRRSAGASGSSLVRVGVSALSCRGRRSRRRGARPWRTTSSARGEFEDVTMLLNTAGWVFDDVHPQYTIGLVWYQKRTEHGSRVRLRGPFASLTLFERVDRPPAELDAERVLRSGRKARASRCCRARGGARLPQAAGAPAARQLAMAGRRGRYTRASCDQRHVAHFDRSRRQTEASGPSTRERRSTSGTPTPASTTHGPIPSTSSACCRSSGFGPARPSVASRATWLDDPRRFRAGIRGSLFAT